MSVVPKMAESYTSMANYNKQVFRGAINPLRSNNYNGRTVRRLVCTIYSWSSGVQLAPAVDDSESGVPLRDRGPRLPGPQERAEENTEACPRHR